MAPPSAAHSQKNAAVFPASPDPLIPLECGGKRSVGAERAAAIPKTDREVGNGREGGREPAKWFPH